MTPTDKQSLTARQSLSRIEELLTNVQPKIDSNCYPGRASFIDSYIDAALECARDALTAITPEPGQEPAPLASGGAGGSGGVPAKVWLAQSKTAWMVFATEACGKRWLSQFPPSVSGGFELFPCDVHQLTTPQPVALVPLTPEEVAAIRKGTFAPLNDNQPYADSRAFAREVQRALAAKNGATLKEQA